MIRGRQDAPEHSGFGLFTRGVKTDWHANGRSRVDRLSLGVCVEVRLWHNMFRRLSAVSLALRFFRVRRSVRLIDVLFGPDLGKRSCRASGDKSSAGWAEVAGVHPAFLVGFGGHFPIRQSAGVTVLDDGDGVAMGELDGGMAVEVTQG